MFGELPFREHIEGLVYLYAFGIGDNHDAEVIDLVTSFQMYLQSLTQMIYSEAITGGFAKSLPAIRVIAAIASGMEQEIAHLLQEWDPFSMEDTASIVNPALDEIRKIRKEMLVLDTLMAWSRSRQDPTPELIRTLQEQSGDDHALIIDMADLLSSERPLTDYRPIRAVFPILSARKPELSVGTPPVTGVQNSSDSLLPDLRDDDLIDDEERGEWNPDDEERRDDDYDDRAQIEVKIDTFIESGRNDEAFESLLAQITSGHLLFRYPCLFDLGCTLGRMEELTAFRPAFLSWQVQGAIYLLDAYERLVKKKDIRGGLALVERAGRNGLDGENSLLLSARFLLAAGFPKRVTGLCEKMFRHGMAEEIVYPLLIQAYRDLGRGKEAEAAETRFRQSVS